MQYLFIFGGDSGQVFEQSDYVRFFVGSEKREIERAVLSFRELSERKSRDSKALENFQ